MRTPDHSTVAEFRRRHEAEIAELFDEVLGLCREAGLVSVGVITIDGTRIKANASMDQKRSYREIVNEILREAEDTDRREDELYGHKRGDELPEELRTPEGRRQALADAKRRIEERKGRPVTPQASDDQGEVDVEPLFTRTGGRREWLRLARVEVERRRALAAKPIPRDREDRLFEAVRRIEEDHQVELRANQDYERWRTTQRDTLGRVMKGNSKPYRPPNILDSTINLVDPDSKVMRTKGLPPRQAYNAQAVVTEQQIVVAAEVTVDAPDFGHLEPMVAKTLAHLDRHGVSERPGVVLGDAGYWHTRQIEQLTDQGLEVLVPPDGAMRDSGNRPGWEHERYERMRQKIRTEPGRTLYKLRKITIEPVYGRSNTTDGSITSREEADPPHTPSGGSSRQPTISSSFTPTGSPTPRDGNQQRRAQPAGTEPASDSPRLAYSDSLPRMRSSEANRP